MVMILFFRYSVSYGLSAAPTWPMSCRSKYDGPGMYRLSKGLPQLVASPVGTGAAERTQETLKALKLANNNGVLFCLRD